MTTDTMKKFKELLLAGEEFISEEWTDGHYQIMKNNITGQFIICSDFGLTTPEQKALGGSYDTLETAQSCLQHFSHKLQG